MASDDPSETDNDLQPILGIVELRQILQLRRQVYFFIVDGYENRDGR